MSTETNPSMNTPVGVQANAQSSKQGPSDLSAHPGMDPEALARFEALDNQPAGNGVLAAWWVVGIGLVAVNAWGAGSMVMSFLMGSLVFAAMATMLGLGFAYTKRSHKPSLVTSLAFAAMMASILVANTFLLLPTAWKTVQSGSDNPVAQERAKQKDRNQAANPNANQNAN